MNLWHSTMDDLTAIERDAKQHGGLTIDQRIAIAQARAALTVAQELSLIQDQGIQPEWSPRKD